MYVMNHGAVIINLLKEIKVYCNIMNMLYLINISHYNLVDVCTTGASIIMS